MLYGHRQGVFIPVDNLNFYVFQTAVQTHIHRKDNVHLIKNHNPIGIEDLNVKEMMSGSKSARSVADMSFFEFRRQLEYKAKAAGVKVIVADSRFASSKTCSFCGHKLAELSLSVRQWTCPECGARHDRDVNAAINLKHYALNAV
jgi:putative transposase